MSIQPRVAKEIISSVAGGQPPLRGVEHVVVGRKEEIDSFISALEVIKGGKSNTQFIIGDFGSGKTFLKQYYKWYAVNNNFVVMDANLSNEKRFTGDNSQHYGLNTYRELIKNISTKYKLEGGALEDLFKTWFFDMRKKAAQIFNQENNSESFTVENVYSSLVRKQIVKEMTSRMSDSIYYTDFKQATLRLYDDYTNGEDYSEALDWFKGFNETKTASYKIIDSGRYIKEDNWFTFLKMWAQFVKIMGYRGLLVFIDETEAIYKLHLRSSRDTQYHKILDMYNELRLGQAPYLGMYFFGTNHFLDDQERGCYSYAALGSRLAPSRFGLSFEGKYSPVIMLRQLTDDHIRTYLNKLAELYQIAEKFRFDLTPEEIDEIVKDYIRAVKYSPYSGSNITPRELSREFIAILERMHVTGQSFQDILKGGIEVVADHNPDDDLFMI